jgi:acyl-CoA synthetase (AMP-forming)/AMP-acid ligase II
LQVEQFLEDSARRFPGETALVSGERRLTYREVDERCNRLARAFLEAGVQRGDRVATFLENSVEAVLSIFAALKAGGVFMVINPTTKADKLAFIVNNSRAAALVTDVLREGMVTEVLDRMPHTRAVVVAGRSTAGSLTNGKHLLALESVLDATAGDGTKPDNRCIDIDLAALIYTSGSTGTLKGVMLTHLNIVSAATSITTYLENRSDDIILNVLPLSFDYGLYQVLMAFKIGGTVVLERSFTYPHAVLEKVVAEGRHGAPHRTDHVGDFASDGFGKYDLSQLRYVTNTAATLPTRHIVELRKLLPHVKIYSMYGLTVA